MTDYRAIRRDADGTYTPPSYPPYVPEVGTIAEIDEAYEATLARVNRARPQIRDAGDCAVLDIIASFRAELARRDAAIVALAGEITQAQGDAWECWSPHCKTIEAARKAVR